MLSFCPREDKSAHHCSHNSGKKTTGQIIRIVHTSCIKWSQDTSVCHFELGFTTQIKRLKQVCLHSQLCVQCNKEVLVCGDGLVMLTTSPICVSRQSMRIWSITPISLFSRSLIQSLMQNDCPVFLTVQCAALTLIGEASHASLCCPNLPGLEVKYLFTAKLRSQTSRVQGPLDCQVAHWQFVHVFFDTYNH